MNLAAFHRRPCPPARLGRIFFLPIALLLLTASAPAQDLPVVARISAGDTVLARPGSILALPIRLVNEGRDSVSVLPDLDLLDRWKLVSPLPTALLPGGGSQVVIPVFSVPGNERAGLLPFTVRALRRDDTRTGPWTKAWVRITRVVRIEVVMTDAPRYAVAGETVSLSYELVNRGNDTVEVELDARSTSGYETRLGHRRVSLPAGGRLAFDASFTSPMNERGRIQHSLVLTATPLPERKPIVLSTVTEIVPRASSAAPERSVFPLFASVRATGEGPSSRLQAEVVGAGPLREDGSDRLEVRFRGPETQTISPLGYLDEYRAKYEWGKNQIFAGDWNFVLTPLTEVGRYAMGAGGMGAIGDLGFGGFVNRTRFGVPAQSEAAGWARYRVADESDVGLNVLRRTGFGTRDILSVNGSTRPFSGSRLEIEAGKSSGGGGSMAYAARLAGAFPGGVYDVRSVGAGPDYGGYYRDVRFSSVSVTGFATRTLRTEFTARTERRNLNADTLRGGIPTTGFVQFGVGYNNYVHVSYRSSGLTDPSVLFPYDRREDVFQVRSSYSFPVVSLSAYVDIGSLRDRTLGASSPSTRYALSASSGAIPGQTYNASVELTQNRDLLTGIRTERRAVSMGSSILLGERTQADLNMYLSSASGIAQTYSLLDAALDHVFRSGHRSALRFRRSSFTGLRTDYAIAVEYGIPLFVPLGVRTSSGGIRGTVTGPDGTGIAGVLVSAGSSAAITDAAGVYALPNLAPGVQFLTVDRGTIGLGRITSFPLPLEVNVMGGEETVVHIGIIPGGSISGEVLLFDFDPAAPVDSSVTIARPIDGSVILMVELTNGSEFQRRRTDSRGRFAFNDLRPGTWTMTVSDLALPGDHAVDRRVRTLELQVGGSIRQEIMVLPRRRTIRIIEQGGILQATPAVLPDAETPYGRYIIRKSPSRGGWFAQVAAFAIEALARQEAGKIQGVSGRKAIITPIHRQGQSQYFRVEFGPFENAAAARQFCDSIRE